MKLRLAQSRRIGRVIFFVEGPVDEPGLLRHIFHNVLKYDSVVYDQRDGSIQEYIKKGDPYSKVFVVSMPSSAIKNIPGDEEFRDTVYHSLKEYGLAQDEAFVYFLFDRDRKTNKPEAVRSKIAGFRNPLDNEDEQPGALLLSYPCMQAYYCQANNVLADFPNSRETKKYANVEGLKELSEEALIDAAANMLNVLHQIRGTNFEIEELMDYSHINHEVYEFEEVYWREHKHYYKTLSLLSLALLDLGIIVIG